MLERHRPRWKVCVIDGLSGDRFATDHKCHHALVDGESGITILRRSLATSPRETPHGLRNSIAAEARRLARRALSVSRSSTLVVESLLDGLSGYSRIEPRAFTAPLTPMNEPIQNARSITHFVLPLPAMKRVALVPVSQRNEAAAEAAFESLLRATTSGIPASRPPRRSATRGRAARRRSRSGSRPRAG